jgi:sensor domain CHASE-containing protein
VQHALLVLLMLGLLLVVWLLSQWRRQQLQTLVRAQVSDFLSAKCTVCMCGLW